MSTRTLNTQARNSNSKHHVPTWPLPWLRSSTAARPGAVTSITDLHRSHVTWCRKHGVQPRSLRSLSIALGRLGYAYGQLPDGRGGCVGAREGIVVTWPAELAPVHDEPESDPGGPDLRVIDDEVREELAALRRDARLLALRIQRIIERIG